MSSTWWQEGHPAPQVQAREANADEIPATVAKLLERAESAGWVITVRYARGCSVDGAGRTQQVVERVKLDEAARIETGKTYELHPTGEPRVIESLAVLFEHGRRGDQRYGYRAWQAWWHDGSLSSAISREGQRVEAVGELDAALLGRRHEQPHAPRDILAAWAEKQKPTAAQRKAGRAGRSALEAGKVTAERYGITLEQLGELAYGDVPQRYVLGLPAAA